MTYTVAVGRYASGDNSIAPTFSNIALRVFFTFLLSLLCRSAVSAESWPESVRPFLANYCSDCHSDGAAEGGLDLADIQSSLGRDLSDEASFARWERLFDRVESGEMPPEDFDQPRDEERAEFLTRMWPVLHKAHAERKGTVMRRLNRAEFENTLNDLFGTQLDLAGMLPEDSRDHEFDNVGSALGLSMVHLQRYMDAVTLVLDDAIAMTKSAPESTLIEAGYAETREAEKFVGKTWKKLSDNSVVRFSGGGYPSGMIRGTSVRTPGRYRVIVRGYAYQSKNPITFSVGGTSFARGSEKPIYGFWSFPPGSPEQPASVASIEFETWINERYMITIEPYGIQDPKRYQRKSIEDYDGPGLAILNVTLEGPLIEEWPTVGHRMVFDGLDRREVEPKNPADKRRRNYRPTFEVVTDNEANSARAVLRRVAENAFRRPVTETDIEAYIELFVSERQANNSFEESLRTAVTAIFCSPRFLYLQEQPGSLDDFALASRLSYFLTRTTPDASLRSAARQNRLGDDSSLREQTERLLRSDQFERFLIDFTDNWLDLRDIDFTIPDSKLFPEFDSYLRFSMPLETRAFFRYLIENDLPVKNLVHSDFAMLNSRLAQHYDLPEISGTELRPVKLPPDSVRGGLLSQASLLKVTANGTNTSPVTRGAWVMERILGSPPPPPPPGIPGVEPDIRGASTLRELLDKHRDSSDCNACHRKIDPPGFALESFNPVGGFRERYRTIGEGERVNREVNGRRVNYRMGPDVDSSGDLPGRGAFADYSEFRDLLASDQHRLAKALTEKLLTFATGRKLGFSDRDAVDQIVDAAEREGFGLRGLIHLVVQSDVFRSK
ncbi:MAG: DUF1592 domain-containing protein [Planctomycetota bacterium]